MDKELNCSPRRYYRIIKFFNSHKEQKGKDILMWATIGLVIIFSAYAMVSFVIKGITGGGA